MKKSYTYVPAEKVQAAKEIARALIKMYSRRTSLDNIGDPVYIENQVTSFLDARRDEFRYDLKEWIEQEIAKLS